jgi:hypothetical protein
MKTISVAFVSRMCILSQYTFGFESVTPMQTPRKPVVVKTSGNFVLAKPFEGRGDGIE